MKVIFFLVGLVSAANAADPVFPSYSCTVSIKEVDPVTTQVTLRPLHSTLDVTDFPSEDYVILPLFRKWNSDGKPDRSSRQQLVLSISKFYPKCNCDWKYKYSISVDVGDIVFARGDLPYVFNDSGAPIDRLYIEGKADQIPDEFVGESDLLKVSCKRDLDSEKSMHEYYVTRAKNLLDQ